MDAGPEDNYEEASSVFPSFTSPGTNAGGESDDIQSSAAGMYEDTEFLAEEVKQQLHTGIVSSSFVQELCSQDEMYEEATDASQSATQFRKTSGPPLPPKGSNFAPALPSRPSTSKRNSRGALPLPPKSLSSSRLKSDSLLENPEDLAEDLYEAIPGREQEQRPIAKPRSKSKLPWKK